MQLLAILLFCFATASLSGYSANASKIRALYNSLDPYSVSQHLALYELYPDTDEGKYSLTLAWNLLTGNSDFTTPLSIPLSSTPIDAFIALINKQPNSSPPTVADNDLALIEKMAQGLANRTLKGYTVTNEAEVLSLEPQEIDLAHCLFLSQFGDSPEGRRQLRSYEAAIDLMALQIRARLTATASAEDKIATINEFIFYEMGFRFPPHSLYAKEIDLYTFLPSVLDSHRGVCLGVSILYLSIAQRLSLPLEIVTPPGHIYVRHRAGDKIINIETTARGVHIDCKEYLGIDTLKLPQRNLKEVIGMAHFNQAAAYLAQEKPSFALNCYEKASPYLADDMLLKEFMGYCCILADDEERGHALLQQVAHHIPDYAVSGNSTAADLLSGKADKNALAALLMHVDENRESILDKQKALQSSIKQFPNFKAAHFALAATWLQLHRNGEALTALEKFHELDPSDPTAEYYLAALYAERYHYPKAWRHLRYAEKLTAERNYSPKPLQELRQELYKCSPDSGELRTSTQLSQ